MPNICKTCGNTFNRSSCEFCKREERWDPERIIKQFSPRLQNDLHRLKIPLDKYNVDDIFAGVGFYLRGPTGTGKTLYAAALTVDVMRQSTILRKGPRDFKFVSVPDLMEELKSGFHSDKSSDLITKYKTIDWLVLDDLGVGKATEWALGVLYLILTYRYEYLLPTVFTTNLDGDQLAEKFGDDRIPSRIIAMTQTKLFDVKNDYRLKT